MEKFMVLLPILLLVALYIFIFTRKGETQRAKVSFRGYDWITFFAIIFGVCALMPAIFSLGFTIPEPWPIVIPVLLVVFLFIAVIVKTRAGKPIFKQKSDERINMIYAKSGRNALFATYLALFVHSLTSDAGILDAMWLTITLASGLVVLLTSVLFYYYKES